MEAVNLAPQSAKLGFIIQAAMRRSSIIFARVNREIVTRGSAEVEVHDDRQFKGNGALFKGRFRRLSHV